MPYRLAHHCILLLLLPTILFAFWPGYFGRFSQAPFAFHAHGLTATAWIFLVAAQSWSIHSRRFALHRKLGQLVLVAVPGFVAGAAIAVQSMAAKYISQSEPFYAALGPMLGLDDLISTTALVILVRAGLVNRRRPAIHSGYLLGTVLLVVPPIIARLGLQVPPSWHVGEAIPCFFAALLAASAPKTAQPMLVVIAVLVAKAAADAVRVQQLMDRSVHGQRDGSKAYAGRSSCCAVILGALDSLAPGDHATPGHRVAFARRSHADPLQGRPGHQAAKRISLARNGCLPSATYDETTLADWVPPPVSWSWADPRLHSNLPDHLPNEQGAAAIPAEPFLSNDA